jgi:glycosyltransferase involved in cell wall biosynthesis
MLSLVLPARNWPADRIEACIRSFLRLKSRTLSEIVVVDFGSDRPMVLKVRDPRVRVVRVDAERWSLAEAIDVGVVAVRGPVVAKTDADIVVARGSGPGLDAAVADVASGEVGVALAQAIDLPSGMSAATVLRAGEDELSRAGRRRPRWGQGGLCLFQTAVWNEIGGFDTRFHGWGNEDNDFSDRVRRSGRRLRWLDPSAVRIFHVWHAHDATPEIVKARDANRAVYLNDRSTFRGLRFRHTRARSLPAPSLATAPRPLVTIAVASTPRPHRERMLTEAIRGFAGQIDNDFEVLIVDNGSSDDEHAALTRTLARRPRGIDVRTLHIAEASIPRARNVLTDEARGRYICIADDDDIPLPGRLADHLAPFASRAGIHGSHGGWIDFDEVTGVVDFNTAAARTLASLVYGPGKVSAHPASLVRADVMRRFRYDESCPVGSDFDLAVRMANMGVVFEHTGSFVTLRRFHRANVTLTEMSSQRAVGLDGRARAAETFGAAFARHLRDAAADAGAAVTCRNRMTRDEVIERLPGYVGVWRLLVPLGELGKRHRRIAAPVLPGNGANGAEGPPAKAAPPGANGRWTGLNGRRAAADLPRAAAVPAARASAVLEEAAELARMVEGDVGVIDSGVNPALYFVSERIKGRKRALETRRALERRFDLEVEVLPDVEYERRRTARFDWSRLAGEAAAIRLVSGPIGDLDKALAALSKLPPSSALRAMTAVLADFNCTERRFHLVTAPVSLREGPARVRRVLEARTGESFRQFGTDELRHGGVWP